MAKTRESGTGTGTATSTEDAVRKKPRSAGRSRATGRAAGRSTARSTGNRAAKGLRVQDVMSRDVTACKPHDTLATAARIMWDHDCGAVPVVDESHKVLGIVTDRDICMAALMENRALSEIRVQSTMSKEIHTCQPQESVRKAEGIMQEKKVRRLPVVDAGRQLVGMLTLSDLALEAARQKKKRQRQLTEVEVAETLAAVCEPHLLVGAISSI